MEFMGNKGKNCSRKEKVKGLLIKTSWGKEKESISAG